MRLIFRLILMVILGVLICLIGIVFCLFNPRNPKNVSRFAHLLGSILRPILGVKVISRKSPKIDPSMGSCVYIANHQNNYDVLVASDMVQPKTVTIGKKSLVWIPFFGQLYWLTGNILLNRENKSKARDTLAFVINEMHQKGISIWMFPEGTRSQGRGLLPFKTGAFRTAIEAQVPIVPICVSETNHLSLKKRDNGYVITKMLDPISTEGMTKQDAKTLMDRCRALMLETIESLNAEVETLNKRSNEK